MKPQELNNLTKDELLAKEVALKQESFTLNFQRKAGRVEKPHRFKQIRRDIARIHTILRAKEIEESGNKKP